MALSNAAKSGVAIFVGAVQFGIFLTVSEILYSAYGTNGYSVSVNYVSDLGANCRSSGGCYIPPSAVLFNATIAVLGVAVLVGAYFLHRAFRWAPATAVVTLAGVGALGVGLFPETAGDVHVAFSFIVFFFAGLSALLTYRFQKAPLSYFSIFLGIMTLVALFMSAVNVNLGLGVGGIERMVVFPALLWAIGFGGHMMAIEDKAPTKATA